MATAAPHDPVFESQSGYMFEEPGADEEFRNMQRNIASLNVLTDGQRNLQQSMCEPHVDNNMSIVDEQYQPGFVNPFVFNEDNPSPRSSSWTHARQSDGIATQSMQEEIANSRNESVKHKFGQITPPTDEGLKDFASGRQGQQKSGSPPLHTVSSAKSERARNAANQRHAKAKKAKKDEIDQADSPESEGDGVDEGRRERYREKNRLAAAKCRAKKKVNTEDLEESARMVTARNNKLRAEERELRDLFSSLRDQALAHDPSQGCGCRAIHSYNLHKAQQTARGAMGLHGMMNPAPRQRSFDSASPTDVGASSRAQSFSGMRPQFNKHGQSMASHMGYMEASASRVLQQPSSATADMAPSDYDFMQSSTGCDGDEFQDFMQRHSDGPQLYHNS